jgi:hypothetical protein
MSLMSPKMGQSKEGKKEVDAPTAAGGTRTASIIGHVVSKLWKIILSYCTFKIFWDIFVLMDNLYIYWAKACTIFRFSLLCFGMVEFEQQVKYACFFYSFVWGPSTDGLGYTMWLTRDVPKCDGVSFRMWVTLEGIRTSPLLMGCLLCPFRPAEAISPTDWRPHFGSSLLCGGWGVVSSRCGIEDTLQGSVRLLVCGNINLLSSPKREWPNSAVPFGVG